MAASHPVSGFVGRSLSSSRTSSLSDFRGVARRPPGELTPLLDGNAEERRQQQYETESTSVEDGVRTGGSNLTKKIKYYIPSFTWIPEYSISLLAGDILGGITLASLLVPQSISYATSLSKLGPANGLFAASIPSMAYAFLGTSRQLSVAPEAALSLLVGQAVTAIRQDFPELDPHELGSNVSTIITFQVGLFSFLLGIFRLGFIDVVLSRALLRGFITALAFTIMIDQLIPMLGLSAVLQTVHPNNTVEKIAFVVERALTDAHIPTTMVAFGSLFALILFRIGKDCFKNRWYIYRLPEVLIVVGISTFLCGEFRWDKEGVAILGSVPVSTGSSFIQFPLRRSNTKYLRETTSTAALTAVLGFLDSIIAAKQNGARYRHAISPNRELVALGVANLTGSFIPGTPPAFGAITRTRINGDVGARSQLSSLVAAALILFATFFLLPWLYYLPNCVLGSIVCLVVWSLLAETPHDVSYYFQMGAWVDLSLMSLTFFLAMVYDIEVAIVVSLVISLLFVVHRSSRARMAILGRIPSTDRWKPVNENPEAEESVTGALIIRIRENLDFANTAQLKERLRRLELYGTKKSHPSEDPSRQEASVLVFHLADVETVDASAAQIFFELLEEYKSRGVGLYITHLAPGLMETFTKAGIVDLLGFDAFRVNVQDAMSLIESSGT